MVHFNSVSRRTTFLGSTDIRVSRIGTGTNRWAIGENDEPVFRRARTGKHRSLMYFKT
jgi:hypothetical protein